MNYGFNVKIKYTKESVYYRAGDKGETLHNITEIYYNSKSPLLGFQVAFGSDIHGIGCTRFIDEVEEFEAILATKKEKEY